MDFPRTSLHQYRDVTTAWWAMHPFENTRDLNNKTLLNTLASMHCINWTHCLIFTLFNHRGSAKDLKVQLVIFGLSG